MKYIISESRLNGIIVQFLDDTFHADHIWGPELYPLYKHEMDRHGYYEFHNKYDIPLYAYVGKDNLVSGYMDKVGAKTIMIRPAVWQVLDNYFGDRWESVFVKWFEDNTGLSVEHLVKYEEGW